MQLTLIKIHSKIFNKKQQLKFKQIKVLIYKLLKKDKINYLKY